MGNPITCMMRNHSFSCGKVPGGRVSFTLIELLVVIAIISILTALLLPALSRTKLTARRVVCMEQMKQVSLALFMLGNDNNGWLNGINTPLDVNGDNDLAVSWAVSVHPYLSGGGATNSAGEDVMVMRYGTGCPGRSSYKSYLDLTIPATTENGYPFGVNALLTGRWGSSRMHSLNEVTHTSRIYLISDCFTLWPDPYNNLSSQAAMTIDGQWGGGNYYHPPHPAKGNVAFDGALWTFPAVGNGLNFIFIDGHGQFLRRYRTDNWAYVEGIYAFGQASLWQTVPPTSDAGTYDMSGE